VSYPDVPTLCNIAHYVLQTKSLSYAVFPSSTLP
jgi:hypothetical protein